MLTFGRALASGTPQILLQQITRQSSFFLNFPFSSVFHQLSYLLYRLIPSLMIMIVDRTVNNKLTNIVTRDPMGLYRSHEMNETYVKK